MNNKRKVLNSAITYLSLHAILVVLWWTVYTNLRDFSVITTYSILQIAKNSKLGASIEFFLYDVPKVFMLLGIVIYFVGLLRTFITPEKTRKILAGKKKIIGNILAALLGIVTPFCSCSAIPLFIGFVSAGVPFGATFSFLVSAPMINEIALILLYGLLGWKIAALYLMMGLGIAIISGLIIGNANPEKYVESWIKKIDYKTSANADSSSTENDSKINWRNRISFGRSAVKEIYGKIWFFILIGIAVGAIIHGYVPEKFMASIMGAHSWWSVPLAVIVGIPLYSNAAGIIPIVEALISKGAAIGSVLAFMMSVTALSFPEMVILRKVLKPRLIFIFLITVATGIIAVGYFFNFIITH